MSNHGRVYYAVLFILLPALLLGAALRFFMQDYLKNTAFDRLQTHAEVLCDLTAAYHSEGSISNMQFFINLDLTAKVSQADAVVCNPDGVILLCSDSPTGCKHRGLSVGRDYLERVTRQQGTQDTGIIQGLYEEARYVCAKPVYAASTGQVAAIVMVSTPVEQTDMVLNWVGNMFALASLAILLLSAVCMNYFSQRHEHPLREMAKTTAAFGHGDLEARVNLMGRYPEEVEELALSINNMADSLQKSEYSRQEFVANVSHELKTPMTTISGYVDGMLDGTIPQEAQRKYMRIVSDETKRLARLVRSMLDISQLQGEGGIPDEKLNRFDMEECIGQTLITFEQKILGKELQLDVDMPEYPVYTIANQDYISQVVYNLLDNAVKFCPQGGNLTVSIREGTSKLYVTVANDGNTIPPEELSLLFDRFHKIDKSRNRNSDGWGLGLYIVKTIIGLHGEDISVTSKDGRTAFTFTLPLYN